MKTLSITTSSNICSVAILEDEKLIKQITINDGHTHSEKLMPIIQQIFLKTNLNLNNINLLVCDNGPGSFTGIRIGIATIKAFSDSLNIPCIGVSALEALCYNVTTNNSIICSLIDAKNSNVYFGLFKLENGKYTSIQNLSAITLDNAIQILQKYKNDTITFVGDGSNSYKDILKKYFENSNIITDSINSYYVGLCGYNKFLNNFNEELLPLYLKKPQAERMLEEKINTMKKDCD